MWGTVISVDVRDPVDPRVVDDVFAWFRRVDDLFSTWRADTEISRIGRGELEIARRAPRYGRCWRRATACGVRPDGAFDITVGAHGFPPRPGLAPLDPSGFVKGWALERAAEHARGRGRVGSSINAGGDVVVRGGPTTRPLADRDPAPVERDKVADVVVVTRGAVATSGRSERGDHVIDPRTRRPALGLVSATVVGPISPSPTRCATAPIAVRVDRRAVARRDRPEVAALAVTDDGHRRHDARLRAALRGGRGPGARARTAPGGDRARGLLRRWRCRPIAEGASRMPARCPAEAPNGGASIRGR